MDVWRAPALKFEKPQHTDARDLTAQSLAERVQVAFYILTIVGELSGICQCQHRGKHNIGVACYKSKPLSRPPGEHRDIAPDGEHAVPRDALAHHNRVLPVELDADHRQDGIGVGCHGRFTVPGDTRWDQGNAVRYGTSDKPVGRVISLPTGTTDRAAAGCQVSGRLPALETSAHMFLSCADTHCELRLRTHPSIRL